MSDKLKVTEPNGLLKFLIANLHGWTRNKIKQRLVSNAITVNGQVITKHDYLLEMGDDIEILASTKKVRSSFDRLEIIYSDKDLVAINKPVGMLSVADGKSTTPHALGLLRAQLSRPNKPVKIWPVHRLDRDTSGVLLFATSLEMREAVNALWSEADKVYLAIVEGVPNPKNGTIDQPLRLDSYKYQMHVGRHPEAKKAVTHYITKQSTNSRSLVEVRLDTGRQHQIRAHMSWLGCPVVGDVRYGKPGSRMGLHALRLSIKHPVTNNMLTFETQVPNDFMLLFNQ